MPYVKGPLAPHGEQQHFWHCRAENHDVAELVEEVSAFLDILFLISAINSTSS